jgi:hypothetical protein
MGKGYKHGGANPLNFKVVPGLTQPGTASGNTIWVKTEKINAWYFSATQPEGMQEWDVWFKIGTKSLVEFNALRKNGLQVYPANSKQYVDGALVTVPVKIYQNGAWVDLWDGELFDNGNQFETITGGWTQFPDLSLSDTSYHNTGTVSIGDTIRIETPYSDVSAIATTKNKIDLTDYSQIMFVVDEASSLSSSSDASMSCQVHDNTTGKIGSVAATTVNTTGTAYVDISNVSGMYYISAQNGYGRTHSISEVKLIK